MNQDQLLSDDAVVNADNSAPGTMNHEKPEHPKKLDWEPGTAMEVSLDSLGFETTILMARFLGKKAKY